MFNYILVLFYLIGLSLISVVFFRPRWLLYFAALIVPGVVYFAQTDKPIIALTIDDGPDATTTQKIIEILHQYEARATFFVISDRVKGNEFLVREMVSQGHELAPRREAPRSVR